MEVGTSSFLLLFHNITSRSPLLLLFFIILALLVVSLASKINSHVVPLKKSFVIDDETYWSIHTVVNDFSFILSCQTCGGSTE